MGHWGGGRRILARPQLGGLLTLAALAAAIWAIGIFGEAARDALALDRAVPLPAEAHRLLTAHLVHLNEAHLRMNLLGIGLIGLVLFEVVDARGVLRAFLVSGLAVGLGLLWLAPEVGRYFGFSGVTHGLFAWGGLRLWRSGRRGFAALVLATLAGKILWERIAGPAPGAEAAIAGRIVLESHLFGAIGGVLAYALEAAIAGRIVLESHLFGAIGGVLAYALEAGLRRPRPWHGAVAAVLLALQPYAAGAHNSAVTEAELGVNEDGAVVLSIQLHLAAFTLRQPLSPLDEGAKAFLRDLPEEELTDYVRGASAFLVSRTRLVVGEEEIAPARIRYPAPAAVRAEGLNPNPLAPAPPILLLFERGAVSGEQPVRLKLPERVGAYRLSVYPTAGSAFIQMAGAGEMSDPFTIAVPAGWVERTIAYLWQGITHVVPHGWDHTFFIAALALALPRLGPVVIQASIFTLAHSITLSLAVLEIIVGPTRLIEIGIAASIATMGLANVALLVQGRVVVLTAWRCGLIFLFGLLHGLGFASVFGDLDLPAGDLALALASFNIGVELGQIFVLLLVLLAIRIATEPRVQALVGRSAAPALRMAGSAVIAVAGLFWTAERVGLFA